MKSVENFVIENTRAQRKQMLKLEEPCHERGLKYSTQLVALVAYHYDTTMPVNGNSIVVCHGCNNPKCSNPNHMYWGTKSDNKIDEYENGAPSIYQRMIDKHGKLRAKEILKKRSSNGGKGNKGKAKSDEHKQKIREAITGS